MTKLYTEQYYLNKKERLGIISLLIILTLTTLIPLLWRPPESKFFQADGVDQKLRFEKSDNAIKQTYDSKTYKHSNTKKVIPSKFNPNTMNESLALKIGFTKKLYNTLYNYRKKGGKFKNPEDLKKLYGMDSTLYNQILPYIELNNEIKVFKKDTNQTFQSKILSQPKEKIEINNTSIEQLVNLPCLGPKLSERIIKFRDALGGFNSLTQIAEVYGLSDSCYTILKSLLECNSIIRHLAINHLDIDELESHPYVNRKQANFIVQYRRQHFRINNINEMRDTKYFEESWLNKMSPYFDFK